MTTVSSKCSRSSFTAPLIALACVLTIATQPASANPNMVANGDLDRPPTPASVRVSGTENEAIYEVSGDLNFGRVIARASQSAGKLAQSLSVGYFQYGGGAGLMIDASEIKDVKGDYEISVWFDLLGTIRPNRQYSYSMSFIPTSQKSKVPEMQMVAPAFWADGEFHGAEVDFKWPEDKDRRGYVQRGIVKTPEFNYATGGQWMVLKLPKNFKDRLLIQRASLRELDEALLEGKEAVLPTPTRYITIDDVLEEQIQTAQKRTPEALKRTQNREGYWNAGAVDASVGISAYILGTLARHGEDMKSKPMRAGIKWLAEQELTTTNAVGNRLYFLANYGLPEFRQTVAIDINTLVDAQYEDGGWSTSVEEDAETEDRSLKSDNSSSMDAVAALREAYYAGYEIKAAVWRKAAGYFREAQARDGGFRAQLDKYGGLGEATTTMNTALGMTGLYMTLDMGFAAGSSRCTQYLSNSRQISGLRRGLEWLDDYYDEYYKKLPTLDTQSNPILNALAMQTFMEVSGVLNLHEKNVFRTEAEAIMPAFDQASGLFGGSLVYSAAVLDLLDSGSAPIVFQRHIVGGEEDLEFSRDGDHLARYLRRERKRPLNWRMFNIDDPIDELLDVPLLYVHVAGGMDFEEKHWKRLRDYCFGGGVAVFNVAEDYPSGVGEIEKGLAVAFPEYKLEDIDKEGSILTIKHKIKEGELAGMRTLGNGVKDFVFLPASDWSCKLNTYAIDADETPFRFFDNLLHYTMDSDPPRSSFLTSTWEIGTSTVKSAKVAHMEVGTEKPVFPDLLSTLSRSLEAGYRMSIKSASVDKPSNDIPLLWLSCTGPTQLTSDQLKTIDSHIKRGTFVFAEVITGNENWAETFRADLQKLDGDIRIRRLVANHPVLNGKLYETFGFDVRTVKMRRTLRDDYEKLPRIDAYLIERDGEEIGMFTTHDVGSGLGYFMYPKCRGIMPRSSRELSANIVLYSMQRALLPNL